MSIRTPQKANVASRHTIDELVDLDRLNTPTGSYTRNPSWSTLTALTSGDEKFMGLVAVYPESSFLALVASGNYTVDWGDGTVENYSAGATGLHLYDYTYTGFANTNAPVTFVDSTDTVSRTSHGYTDGMEVQFFNIATTTGIIEGATYYVVNSSANSFKVSNSPGGSVVALTNDGSANLLKYKQAIVTVTPQSGQQLTAINLNVKHTQAKLQTYDAGWLDIEVSSPNFSSTGLVLFGDSVTQNIKSNILERIAIRNCGNATTLAYRCSSLYALKSAIIKNFSSVTSMASLFSSCYNLISVDISSTSAVTNTSTMFFNCWSLVNAPFFDTSGVTNATSMFNTCYRLVSAPEYNWSSVTNLSQLFTSCRSLVIAPKISAPVATDVTSIFSGCYSLRRVSFLSCPSATTWTSAFSSCYSLVEIGLFNTSAGTNFSSMFNSCISLKSVPLLDLSSATNVTSMFFGCYSLKTIPLFNTVNVTNFTSFFSSCFSLTTIPLINTSSATNMTQMFNNCSSLTTVPLLNTANVTNMQQMFGQCYSLQSVPLFNTVNVTNMSLMFTNCSSLITVPYFNTSNVTNMQQMFYYCYAIRTVPAFDTSKVTNFSYMFYNCTGLQYLPLFNTSAGTDFTTMAYFCTLLEYIPAINISTTAGTIGIGGMFLDCANLARFAPIAKYTTNLRSSKMGADALKEVMDNMETNNTSQTFTITNCHGAPTPVSLSGTTTVGSTTVTMANTTGISTGMQVTGTGTPLTTAIAVTFQDTGDTVTLTAHGLSNGDEVSFPTIVTTTGITTNKIYFVVNKTNDTFQVALTAGGAAIALTSNGSGTMRYRTEVASIVTNTSVTLTRPATSSGTNTLAFQTLKTGTAILKNWTISQ